MAKRQNVISKIEQMSLLPGKDGDIGYLEVLNKIAMTSPKKKIKLTIQEKKEKEVHMYINKEEYDIDCKVIREIFRLNGTLKNQMTINWTTPRGRRNYGPKEKETQTDDGKTSKETQTMGNDTDEQKSREGAKGKDKKKEEMTGKIIEEALQRQYPNCTIAVVEVNAKANRQDELKKQVMKITEQVAKAQEESEMKEEKRRRERIEIWEKAEKRDREERQRKEEKVQKNLSVEVGTWFPQFPQNREIKRPEQTDITMQEASDGHGEVGLLRCGLMAEMGAPFRPPVPLPTMMEPRIPDPWMPCADAPYLNMARPQTPGPGYGIAAALTPPHPMSMASGLSWSNCQLPTGDDPAWLADPNATMGQIGDWHTPYPGK